MAKSISSTLTLSNAVEIPQLGFGVYKSPTNLTTKSTITALDLGYRHIDTAQLYGNEKEVGQAVQQSALSRKDVFITTKICFPEDTDAAIYKQCIDSVNALHPEGGDASYVDLFLIHSPHRGKTKRVATWKALERLYEEGRAKSIGVSNFGIKHIEGLKEHSKVWPPHVLQIELHPWHQQKDIVKYCNDNNILVQAYCPIVRNRKSDDPTVAKIAQKHAVTPNQVLIRYCLEKGWVPLPKSDNPDRIKTNGDVFGFQLDDADMKTLNDLDQGPEGAIVEAVINDNDD